MTKTAVELAEWLEEDIGNIESHWAAALLRQQAAEIEALKAAQRWMPIEKAKPNVCYECYTDDGVIFARLDESNSMFRVYMFGQDQYFYPLAIREVGAIIAPPAALDKVGG